MSWTLVLAILACVLLVAVLFAMYVAWRLRIWADGMIAAFPELLEVARQQRASEAVQVSEATAANYCPRLELGS
jgi:uncharacterized membrane protein